MSPWALTYSLRLCSLQGRTPAAPSVWGNLPSPLPLTETVAVPPLEATTAEWLVTQSDWVFKEGIQLCPGVKSVVLLVVLSHTGELVIFGAVH